MNGALFKSECLNPKYETSSKFKIENHKTPGFSKFSSFSSFEFLSAFGRTSRISIFVFRILG